MTNWIVCKRHFTLCRERRWSEKDWNHHLKESSILGSERTWQLLLPFHLLQHITIAFTQKTVYGHYRELLVNGEKQRREKWATLGECCLQAHPSLQGLVRPSTTMERLEQIPEDCVFLQIWKNIIFWKVEVIKHYIHSLCDLQEENMVITET